MFVADVADPIKIEITIGSLDDAMKGIDTYGLYLGGYNSETGAIVEEPEANHETVLTMQLLVQADLEPQWTLISARGVAQGFTRNLAWGRPRPPIAEAARNILRAQP